MDLEQLTQRETRRAAQPDAGRAPSKGRSKALPLVAISLGYFMVILDATIVTVALPTLGRQLGGGVAGLQWVVDAYTVALAGTLLLGGWLSDRFGSRRVFQASLVGFSLASLACGLAPSLGALIAARAAQGVGAALAVPSSLALLRAAYPETRERARAFGVWGGIAGIAAASGPVLGGVLTAAVSWRAVFMVNLPIGALALWLVIRHVTSTSRSTAISGIDPVGQVTAIAALGGLVLALIEAGQHGWGQPPAIAGLGLFVVAGAVWLLTERRVAQPMLPPRVFASRTFSGATAAGLLLNLGFYGQLFVMSLYLQHVRHQSAALAGVALLPEALSVMVASPLSGRITGRVGPRVPMATGMLAGALGFGALALARAGTPYGMLVAPMVAAGFGTSFTMPAATAAVMGAAPDDRGGLASGVLNASRQVGGAVGIALLGALVASGRGFTAGMPVAMLVAAAAFAIGALISATIVQ
jgi:DHA2 family methylenomycin A resistance protein-like MFS transporter